VKLDEHSYEYSVKDVTPMRNRIRTIQERLRSSGGISHKLRLKNQAGTKQVDIKLDEDGNGVKFTVLDKAVYTRKELYKLVKEALGLR
jgi:hypothetical protein